MHPERPNNLMPGRLTGQPIGSIRQITFTRPDGLPGASYIELETKPGRYVHFGGVAETAAIRLTAGAAQPPPGRGMARHWLDLTTTLPCAFDGRPAIRAIEPIQPIATDITDAIARCWRVELSTGAVISIHWSSGLPLLECLTS